MLTFWMPLGLMTALPIPLETRMLAVVIVGIMAGIEFVVVDDIKVVVVDDVEVVVVVDDVVDDVALGIENATGMVLPERAFPALGFGIYTELPTTMPPIWNGWVVPGAV
jgi:hypothetical protein